MTWTKLSDDFPDDCETLSVPARWLHVEGLCWSNRKLLDCRIPKAHLRKFATDPECVTELVATGWWTDEDDAYVLTVPAPAGRVQAGRRSVLRGEVRPSRTAIVVEAARQLAPARYARPLVVRGRAAGGRFRIAVPLVRPGVYRLRVRFAGDRRNAPAQVDHVVRAVRRLGAPARPVSPPAPDPSGGSGGQPAR